MIDHLLAYWPQAVFAAAVIVAGMKLYRGHETRIRDLEEALKLGAVATLQNFTDHASIKTTLGVLEVKVDRSSEAVNSLVLYLKLKDDKP